MQRRQARPLQKGWALVRRIGRRFPLAPMCSAVPVRHVKADEAVTKSPSHQASPRVMPAAPGEA